MTSFERFENRLPAMLDELAVPRLPDYADELFARTAATRQRPGWTFPERWFPMSTLTQRLAAAPRIPWRLGVLVALLAVAALIAVLVSGSFFTPVPAPYGPAGNGQVVFVDNTGRVVLGDPTTNTTRIVADVTGATSPLFSRDGRRIAFLRRPTDLDNKLDLMVADADGTRLLQLSEAPIPAPIYMGWSPNGDRLVVLEYAGLLLYDTTKTAAPTDLSMQLGVRVVGVGPGYNFGSTSVFRAKDEEIVFVGGENSLTLMAAGLDGSGLRTLLDPANSPVAYSSIRGAEWSPDGSQLTVLLEFPDHPTQSHVFLLNADGSGLRALSNLSTDPQGDQNGAAWSPDGTRIAFQYWIRHVADADEDFKAIGVVDVATGRQHDVGPVNTNGAFWEWSPDGQSILEVGSENPGKVLIIDATTGLWESAPWTTIDSTTVNQSTNWQRVAR